MKTSVIFSHRDNKMRHYCNRILDGAGFAVKMYNDCSELQNLTYSDVPDIIILGIDVENAAAFDVLREIRSWSDVPIAVVLQSGDDGLLVKAFEEGADDCMVYPFSAAELVERTKNALRHRRIFSVYKDTYSADGLEINFLKRSVTINGKIIRLTPTEYKILELLCRHSGEVLTYEYILRQIWGPYVPSSNKILRVNMTNIRHKIDAKSFGKEYIHTENGIGYSILKCE